MFRCAGRQFLPGMTDDCPSPPTSVLTVIEGELQMKPITLDVPDIGLSMIYTYYIRLKRHRSHRTTAPELGGEGTNVLGAVRWVGVSPELTGN